jgi:hypothetical protein
MGNPSMTVFSHSFRHIFSETSIVTQIGVGASFAA